MARRDEAWLDGKLVNFLGWASNALARYAFITDENKEKARVEITKLLGDKSERQKFTSELTLYGITRTHPMVVTGLVALQRFYHLAPENREEETKAGIAAIQQFIDCAQKALDALKEDQEALALDLRTVGAYTEIFFGPYLKQQK